MYKSILFACVYFFCGLPVFAQTIEQDLNAAESLVVQTEYAPALEKLNKIPNDAPAAFRIRKNVALVYIDLEKGRFAEARQEIAAAEALIGESGDPLAATRVQLARSNLYLLTGPQAKALDQAKRALDMARASGDRQLLGGAYRNLSRTYQIIEDWEQTIFYAEKAFALRESPTLLDRFNYAMQTGVAYSELHERDRAESQYLEALQLATQMGLKRELSFVRGEMGFLYWNADRDAKKAIDSYQAAIDLAYESGVPATVVSWLNNLGVVLRDTGRYAQALDYFQKVIQIEKQIGANRVTFNAKKNVGQTYRLMGRNREAVEILEPLLKDSAFTSLRLQWQTHMELASAFESLNEHESARQHYVQTLSLLEEQRHTAILDSSRTGSFAQNLKLYDPYERYIRFLSSSNEPADAGEAFHVSERAKARGLLDMFAGVRSAVAASLPASVLEEENGLMEKISTLQGALRKQDLNASERQDALSKVTSAEQELERWRLNLRFDHPSLAQARYAQILSPADLQHGLRVNETVVAFFLGEQGSFRWAVTRDSIRMVKLPSRRVIEEATKRMRALLLVPGDPEAARLEAASLGELLLGGLDLPQDGAVVVAPHGVLDYVPFEFLSTKGGLLIQHHAVTYAPSVNTLLYLRNFNRPATPFRLLALGNPVSNHNLQSAALRSSALDSVGLLDALPQTQAELNGLRRAFPAQSVTLTQEQATESRFHREDLSQFKILHFATHGLIDEDHPNRSALVLSPEDGEDGLLQVPEIYRLRLNAESVILSACQTALGAEVTGEGIVGLSRAFFYAGARSVVASLWNLNDRFAADFMEQFYGQIRKGLSLERALQETKIGFLADARYSHPYYWSTFVLAGDGSQPPYAPPVGSLSRFIVWVAVIGLALILIRRFVN